MPLLSRSYQYSNHHPGSCTGQSTLYGGKYGVLSLDSQTISPQYRGGGESLVTPISNSTASIFSEGTTAVAPPEKSRRMSIKAASTDCLPDQSPRMALLESQITTLYNLDLLEFEKIPLWPVQVLTRDIAFYVTFQARNYCHNLAIA